MTHEDSRNGSDRLNRTELLRLAWQHGHEAPQRLSTARLVAWLRVRGVGTRRY